jgi:hypothetical protein
MKPVKQSLDEMWVTIHFRENSIPSLKGGLLTNESKQAIKDWMLELVENTSGYFDEDLKISWVEEAELRNKIKEE